MSHTLHDKAEALNKELLRLKAKAERLEKFKLQLESVARRNAEAWATTQSELNTVLNQIPF